MKIAWFTDTYLPQTNGVVAYISDAIGVLSKRHEVVLFAPGEGEFRIEQASPNFRIVWIPSSPFPFYEGYRVASIDYARVSSLLGKEKPDIVHAHAPINLGIQGVIAAKAAGIPSVVTYHTHFPDYVPHLMSGRLPPALQGFGKLTARAFVRQVFGMADVVAAPTRELARELRSYGLKKAICIHNGIDYAKLRCKKADAEAFRKAHGIGKGKKVVLYLGRLSFEKKVDVLLRAFRRVQDGNSVLVLAGGGPYLERFRKLAAEIGVRDVIFTGRIPAIGPAYLASDVFASASDSETFGLTFAEAMHMGLPVVGVRRLGAKEVVREGVSGILVEPEDADAMAKAIKRLLQSPALRKRMGNAGKRESERYSIGNSARKTLSLYRRLLRGG